MWYPELHQETFRLAVGVLACGHNPVVIINAEWHFGSANLTSYKSLSNLTISDTFHAKNQMEKSNGQWTASLRVEYMRLG
jgi:hypothetical protein